ncbi:MAG TPA: protein kinase [Polyangiales bacterium]|nr:protein kinase [Polyangiales bacterium]
MEPTDIIGSRYRLDRKIGQGGTGSIWLAQDARLERQVAIKFLFARTSAQQERLARRVALEAKIAASIQHHSVVQIFDFGVHESNVPYIVMEALTGFTLGDAFDDNREFTLEALLRIMSEVLAGLAVVHQAGIVHRDIKPENIFLVKERGDRLAPKLLDFGISRSLDPETRRSAVTTHDGMIVGTPQYMSPEQARGLADIDKTTDIYSIGVILFEAITGFVPFDSPNLGDLLMQVIRGPAPSMLEIAPQLGEELCAVVDKALQNERTQRYADAAEMHEALLAAVAQIPPEIERAEVFSPAAGVRRRARANRSAPSKEAEWLQGGAAIGPNTPSGTEATVHVTKAVRRSSRPPGRSRSASSDPPSTPAAAPGGGRRWLMLGLGAATLLVVTVLVTIALLDRPSQGEPGFIVVQAATPEAQPADTASAARGALPANTLPPVVQTEQASAEPRAKRPGAKPRKGKPEAPDSLQLMASDVAAAFSRQKSKVINCLDQHPEDMHDDAPELTVRVTVGGSGAASNVQLLPESMSSKRVGGCVTQAVLSMSFPAQDQPTTFRIPLHWRRK